MRERRIECEGDLVFFSIAVIKHLQKAPEGKGFAWLTLPGHESGQEVKLWGSAACSFISLWLQLTSFSYRPGEPGLMSLTVGGTLPDPSPFETI